MRRGARGCRLAALLLVAACVRSRPTLPPLRVGTTGDYPPFSVERDGAFAGLDVDVLLRFAADARRRLEIVRTRWPDLTRDLAAGRFDVAIGGVTMRPERALVGTFTRPVATAGAVVLARRSAGGDGVDLDRPGLRLAVNAGGHLERVAARRFPQAVLVRTTANGTLPALVVAGDADAILTDEVEADVFAAAIPDAVRLGPFTRDHKAYLGRDPALVARLDAWLRDREGDGTLGLLRERWLGSTHAGPTSSFGGDLEALLGAIDLRLSFMPAVAAAKRAAGRPIRDPAQEARVMEAARASAGAHGLAPEAVEALFAALIDAARDVQEAFLAHPWAVDPLDLDRDARPALARLSETIVARAADAAAHPELAALRPEDVAARLDGSLADDASRLAIARRVVALRPPGGIFIEGSSAPVVTPDEGGIADETADGGRRPRARSSMYPSSTRFVQPFHIVVN